MSKVECNLCCVSNIATSALKTALLNLQDNSKNRFSWKRTRASLSGLISVSPYFLLYNY